MNTRKLAEGLASLGRNGDSVLVHMTPDEVSGLQAIAKANGTTLTVNPHTGMPEAFSLGNFLGSIAPTVAGVLAAPATGGLSMAPIFAGAATGAVLAKAQGQDMLMGGLTGGLGGFGGGQLGAGLGSAGVGATNAGATTAGSVPGFSDVLSGTAGSATPSGSASSLYPEVNAFGAATPAAPAPAASLMDSPVSMQVGTYPAPFDPAASAEAFKALPTSEAYDAMMKGATNITNPGGLDNFTQAMGGTGKAAMSVGLPLGMATMAGMSGDQGGGLPAGTGGRKYDPYSKLNLDRDTGLRLYADGGTVSTGGIASLYDASDSQYGPQISASGYGIGRLSDLASEAANSRAQTQGYAKGGYTKGPGDGMSDDIPAVIDGKQPARLAASEFVIPADVVSHIGNGSSEAGAKQLYKMLDRIRQARTGTKKQGRQIDPEKHMPA